MSRIAIVDFDGVIADVTEHTKIAQERAKTFVLKQALVSDEQAERKALSTFFYSEQGFFDNTLLEYDQPIPGCIEALTDLLQQYDRVVVVTSRPLSLREATLQWFSQKCPACESIAFFFKNSDENQVKTAAWKASIVARFAKQYDTILFIDDDVRNRKAMETMASRLQNVTVIIQSCF